MRRAIGFVKRSVAVGVSSWDDIRMMLKVREAAGFMRIR